MTAIVAIDENKFIRQELPDYTNVNSYTVLIYGMIKKLTPKL